MTVPSCALVVLLITPGDGGPQPDGRVAGLSPEAARLLRVVEDRGQSYQARVAAVAALAKRREPASVPRLVRLLPGGGDVVTFRVVLALREIGDPRALRALRRVRKDPGFPLPGKINTALECTIQGLERRRR